jgi:hypothetical protein
MHKPIHNDGVGPTIKHPIISKVGVIDDAELGDLLIFVDPKDIHAVHEYKQCDLLDLA